MSQSTFKHLCSTTIDNLNLTVEHYEHIQTGARHYHLSSDDDHNVFLVGFRTPPQDSTGVAHILEHTVLCGSEKYPVRDPFFMMTRRSLNTFMNAFTSSDWTAYPFASKNRQDFENLMDVYLDAAFFPNLNELDFAQEGHRLGFIEDDNPDSELEFKGVVFNEMKGAMSNPVSTLWQTMTKWLYPETTYHYNSGGAPEDIPNLSYEGLKTFHAAHYAPSNAVFFTYGNISATEHQTKFEAQVLSRFEKTDTHPTQVKLATRYANPQWVREEYALDEAKTDNKTHVVVGWLLGENTEAIDVLKAHLLAGVLMENSAFPLLKALETSEFGQAPSPLCGVEDSNREMVFMAGLEGANERDVANIEKLILDTIYDTAENGIPQAMLESVLHQLELSQKEITGDHYPYGLSLILQALPAAIHDADPVALLDLEPMLERLRREIQEPDFVQQLIKRMLLDNPHRVTLTLAPSTTLSQEKIDAEKARLVEIAVSLSDEEKQEIIALNHALDARQQQLDDAGILPKVTTADVPVQMDIPQPSQQQNKRTYFQRATNGITYFSALSELPALSDAQQALLPFVTNALGDVGTNKRDYLSFQQAISACTGGIGANIRLKTTADDLQNISALFSVGGKALTHHANSLSDLVHEMFFESQFSETNRLKDLLFQQLASREQTLVSNGHTHAMMIANQGVSALAAHQFKHRGIAGIKALRELTQSLENSDNLDALQSGYNETLNALRTQPLETMIVSQGETSPYAEDVLSSWQVDSNTSTVKFASHRTHTQSAWTTNTQVNFCAMSFHAPHYTHPDAPALTVLGAYLRNNFLHRTIREQGGAYGSGASFSAENGVFQFFSYRDPRIEGTLDDFRASIDWVLSEPGETAKLEEAILGVVSSIDKPGSPAGDARSAFYMRKHGYTDDIRATFRAQVLQTTSEDLKRVAQTYLKDQDESIGIITNPSNEDVLRDLALDINTL